MKQIRHVVPLAAAGAGGRRLWSVKDVCLFLGLSKRWLHERTRLGKVPCYRFGAVLRFDPEEITAWTTKFHHSPADNRFPAGEGGER